MQKDFQVESSIYSQDSVISAIEDFSEVTQITFEKDILSISWDSDSEIQETFHEFMNYILSL